MDTKTITRRERASYTLMSPATTVRAVIKADATGTRWAWVRSGKRVTVRRVASGDKGDE